MLECASLVGMGEIATKEAFQWITSFPKIVQASAIICHILDDITSHDVRSYHDLLYFYHIIIFHNKFALISLKWKYDNIKK
ncbi:hypothetical protein MUK42_12714 [Musa troglodytarum]|uniref:Terpene synthase metal-binding domain-containing protein n=1 Tax=Musa troglodytarum TaxID=320322 RepID=A0A9E7KEC1_9LILI|nr:hypothetical protein MUK42_12714 [Musa troglodytarum]